LGRRAMRRHLLIGVRRSRRHWIGLLIVPLVRITLAAAAIGVLRDAWPRRLTRFADAWRGRRGWRGRRCRRTILLRTSRLRRTSRRGIAAGRDRLPVRRLVIGSHRDGSAPLDPALYGTGLRAQLVARGWTGHLLVTAAAWIVIAAIPIAGHRRVIIAGAIGRDRLIVAAGLVADHRLIVTTLDVTRGADLRTRLRAGRWAGRSGVCRRSVGRGDGYRGRSIVLNGGCGPLAAPAGDLEDITPGGPSRRDVGGQQH